MNTCDASDINWHCCTGTVTQAASDIRSLMSPSHRHGGWSGLRFSVALKLAVEMPVLSGYQCQWSDRWLSKSGVRISWTWTITHFILFYFIYLLCSFILIIYLLLNYILFIILFIYLFYLYSQWDHPVNSNLAQRPPGHGGPALTVWFAGQPQPEACTADRTPSPWPLTKGDIMIMGRGRAARPHLFCLWQPGNPMTPRLLRILPVG